MLTFILAGLAIVGFLSLLGRIVKLEQRLSSLEEKLASASHVVPAGSALASNEPLQPVRTPILPMVAMQAAGAPQLIMPAAAKAPPQPALQPPPPRAWTRATESVFGLVRKNPFASAGVLMLLIGFGFLFSLLAARDILPPAVRVLLVGVVGAAMFGLGMWQEKSRQTLGLNLQGGALALGYLCGLWAYQGYHLIGAVAAFIWLGGLSTLAFVWAVRTERSLFAIVGLAGALLTPIIAATNDGTFSALVLYAAWVGLLSIGVGLRLHAASLASLALAGTSVLLGLSLDLPHGSRELAAITLPGMAAAYSAAAIRWTWASQAGNDRQQASILSILAGAPLVAAAFLSAKAGVSAGWCALLLAGAATAYLIAMRRATAAWSGWLLAIGAGLGLVAVGVGLEGASRAIALATSAMGLLLLAQASGKHWANLGALLYWGLSVIAGLHAWDNGSAGTTPLAISGAVALGAGYVARHAALSLIYPMSAPLIFCIALLRDRMTEPTVLLLWFLLWALVAQLLGYRLHWRGLRLSAFWLLPAGLFLFAMNVHDASAAGWIARELSLATWLLGSTLLVGLLHTDREAPLRPSTAALGVATLAIPLLCQLELARAFLAMGYSAHALIAASILLWSLWSAFGQWLSLRTQFDWQAVPACAAAGGLILAAVASAPPSMATEVSQWIGLGLLALMAHDQLRYNKRPALALRGLAGIVLIGSLLRAIGTAYGLQSGALALAVNREMQPWISLLWAAGGVAVVVLASARKLRPMWMGAGIALGLLIAKMLLVDLSAFTLAAKVGVFLAVGLVFIGLGYFCPLPPESPAQPAAPRPDDTDAHQ